MIKNIENLNIGQVFFDVDLKKVPLLINASSSDCLSRLKMFATSISDIVVECSDEERAQIHMSAVYVSNFVNVMLQIGNKLLQKKNLALLSEDVQTTF